MEWLAIAIILAKGPSELVKANLVVTQHNGQGWDHDINF
jgi:hypothetical protein